MFKKLTVTILTILSISSSIGQLYQYNLPYEREFGKQKVRGEFISYRKVDQAKKKTKDSLENAWILNGTWKMTMTSDTASAIKNKNFDTWNSVTIPSIKSEHKAPMFTPQSLPIMEEQLRMTAPERFTVLQTDAIIPFDYLDKAIFLHIGALSGKATIYVNGKKVAFFRESLIPQEVKISDAVVRGRNSVLVIIDPYNEESVLERWDNQFSSSVMSDVYVFAQPKIRMFDFLHRTTLDPTYKNGLLEAGLVLKTELINSHDVIVYYDLYDMQGKIVNSDYKTVNIGLYRFDTIMFLSSIKNVNLWSAQNPYLYTIVYRVKREGRTLENVIRKVGFRQIEISGDKLLINGEQEPIYGINADLYPELTEQMSSPEIMKNALKSIKSQGFNAIRTPYPLCDEFYSITDELGLYVSETAPICSRGLTKSIYKGGTLANNPAWSSVYVSRATDMFERVKDHTSIIMWELGEDAGNGCCMYDAYNAVKAIEKYRPISYHDAGYEWNSDICMNMETDKPKYVEKPLIPYRMSYDKDYWQNNQGGFLNEKIDGRVADSKYSLDTQLTENHLEEEKTEAPTIEGNFWDILKGKGKKKKDKAQVVTTTAIVSETAVSQTSIAESEETPQSSAATEEPSSPITIKWIDKTTLSIYNGLDHNLNKYETIHTVENIQGKQVPLEMFKIDVEPGQSKQITLKSTAKGRKAYLLIGGLYKIQL